MMLEDERRSQTGVRKTNKSQPLLGFDQGCDECDQLEALDSARTQALRFMIHLPFDLGRHCNSPSKVSTFLCRHQEHLL